MKINKIIPSAISNSSFLHHVLVLMSWTILAQIMSVASMLVLSRLFLPEQFGLYSVFSGLVVMFGIVAASRYEFAIGLPSSSRDAATLFTLCVVLSVFVPLICFAGAEFLSFGVMKSKFVIIKPWWPLVALGATLVGWFNATTYLALRVARFGAVGRSKMVVASVTAGGQILGGFFFSHGNGSLIGPFLLGQLAGSIWLAWAVWDQELWRFDYTNIVSVAKRYIRFPRYIAPGSLLDGLAVIIPVASITAQYSPAEAGIFALAERTLRAPVTLVGSSVLQVFYKRIAELRDDPNASKKLLLRTWTRMAGIAIVPCIVLSALGGRIFQFLFGTAWRGSGLIAETMAISTFFFFISYPTSNILVVNERARSYLFLQVMQVVLVGSAIWLSPRGGVPALGITVARIVAAQTGVYLISMALQWWTVSAGRGHSAG